MFRPRDRKSSINGVILGMVVLVCTTALILLHYDLTGISNEDQSQEVVLIEKSTLSPDSKTLSSTKEEKVRRLPQAIIIGARKSGTRALLKFLEVNPSIRAAKKEVHFFDRVKNYKKGLKWYREQMPSSSAEDITIEKSPAYFVTSGVPERVHTMNSSVRLVLILRDPVTRLISDYSQLVANKMSANEEDENPGEGELYESIVSNDEHMDHLTESVWIEAEKDFERYVLRPDGGIDDKRRAIKVGMYSVYLEKWRSIFPLGQFHFVDGEVLIENPYEELHKLELFLKLEPKIRPENFVFNSKKGFFCVAQEVQGRVYVHNESLDQPHRLNNSHPDKEKLDPICLSKSKGRRHVAVRQDLIDELRRFYAPYNEYLSSLTGKNFSWS